MSPLPILGSTIAYLVDFALPVLLVVYLTINNHRGRTSDGAERHFWLVTACVGIWPIGWVAFALVHALHLQGGPTTMAVLFTLPMSLIPTIFNSNLIHFFFTPSEWAGGGYQFVITAFVVGLIPWAILLPVAIRRRVQSKRINNNGRTPKGAAVVEGITYTP